MQKRSLLIVLLVVVFSFSTVLAQNPILPVAKQISKGVINGSAISLPRPVFPPAARAVNAQGAVNVQVIIDEEGNVESAKAVSGHPLLRSASETAAREAKFKPTLLQNIPVKVTGVIVYNYVGTDEDWILIGMNLGLAEINGSRPSVNLSNGFENEQEQLNLLQKSSTEIQKAQLSNVISTIKAKINAVDLWKFEYGLAKAGVFQGLMKKDNNIILSNLTAFKLLSIDYPSEINPDIIDTVKKVAEFADKSDLTGEDRSTIWNYLNFKVISR